MNLSAIFGFIIGLILASILKIGFFFGLIVSIVLSALFSAFFNPSRNAGNNSDNQAENNLFLVTTFEVLGNISKSKGVITALDIDSANQLMQALGVHGASKQAAQQAFRRGKVTNYPLQQKIAQLKQTYLFRPYFLNLFMEIQIKHVLMDGVIHINERRKLETIAGALGISARQFEQLLMQYGNGAGYSNSQQQDHSGFQEQSSNQLLAQAYRELQVQPSDAALTIKRAYRRLMSQYHPDKIVATATSAKAIEMANKKAQAIQAAYQLIKQARSDL